MFLSVLDIFKIGIGPSSSHTMGPMVAAARFLDRLRASPFTAHGLRARLHGSLAFTGVGHATDRAVIREVPWERIDGVLREIDAERAASDVHPDEWPAERLDAQKARLATAS